MPTPPLNPTPEQFEALVQDAAKYLARYKHALDNVTFEHGPVLAGCLPGDLHLWKLQ